MSNPGGAIVIHCAMASKLNFACHQSAFAFLRELRVGNRSADSALEEVLVTLSANPPFLKPKSWRVERVEPNGSVSIDDRDVELDGAFLLGLTESVRGSVTVVVEKDGVALTELSTPVELLAFNEWGGAGFMPELLAAFSLPNDPAIDRLLREASLVLRKAGRPDGIDGYQASRRERVWEIASALYTAVCNLGVSYAVPPSSFERNGQKIRLPGQIADSRVATCLDLTMLFVSALEQAGLNPVAVLPEGHALAGVWLQPEELSTIVIDEAEPLRKRVQLKELLLFETTFVTSSPPPPFSKAVAAAAGLIEPDRDDSFQLALDLRRARAHRIMPLALTSALPSPPSTDDGSAELAFEAAPALPDFDELTAEAAPPETPAGRLEHWQRKLLDLSLRNALLNHRSTKSSLALICPDPVLLEDKLAGGAKISIQPVPRSGSQQQDEALHRQRTGEVIAEEYARNALEQNQVLADLPPEELVRRSVDLYRKAKSSLEEGGANTLYLAFGFLLWKQDVKENRRFRAPLILVPVTLERKSVRSGVRIIAHDDESRFNTTLLELLRKDFGIDIRGLDGALPKDEKGVDVQGIWDKVRREVKEAPGFEVTEEVVLGHFSFAKYLMWKDMVDRAEALRQSAVVRHLIDTPRDPFPSDIAFAAAAQLDREFAPSDLLTPLPADSSQMAAIASADRGKNFIIIGPPGTGKSQTIANLIAHTLGKGRRVLFVSEKTAALDVVHRRLESVGLGRFCLQLHSSKARKADVLAQLGRAWEQRQLADEAEWTREADRLGELRDRLNLVVDRLHQKRRNGLTAHEAIGVKVRDEALTSRVQFAWPSADRHDEAQLQAMREAATRLRIQAAAIGDVTGTPLQLIASGEWSPQWEHRVVEASRRLAAASAVLDAATGALLDAVGITLPDRSLERLDALAEFAELLSGSHRTQVGYALEADGVERIEALEEAVRRLKAYAEAQAGLSCSYEALAWRTLDGNDIARRWQEAEAAWGPKKFFAKRNLVKEMKAGGAKGEPDPERDAVALQRMRDEGEAIDRLERVLSGFRSWVGYETSPGEVEALQQLGERIRSAVTRLADDPATLVALRSKVRGLLHEGNDLLAPDAAVGRAVAAFAEAHREFREACGEFDALAGESVRRSFASNTAALVAVREAAEAVAARHAELRDWCAWRRARAGAVELELTPLVEAVEAGAVPVAEIEPIFEAAYCVWWSAAVIGEDEVLRSFSTPEHAAAIKEFRQLDSRFRQLTADFIAARLSGGLPDADEVTRASAWGILRRELQKKSRHKPVRQLLEEIPEVVTALAPCLMMSPLSVAQYLPADEELFDLVIFDEASQITVWDAVGTLARGKQVIVAGDPKQMPPTNFFARANDDLESILDEMMGASIPERLLNLHYRSRRESLIAFSNSRYYGNELVTFPAPIHPDCAVSLVRPEGIYARGKERQNEGEARAIVAEILRRITHESEAVRQQSIGVVTFNSEQQTLIENLLDAERSKSSAIEWAFSSEQMLEPVFVKNLETVQGDERDVILFSVTYGPDRNGYVTMNFGPLNRQGGERRLNVAMTRARSEMMVFSTLAPEMIDLSRTSSHAVADLKHFLEYAERGPSVLGAPPQGWAARGGSALETAVARALSDKGWTVHPQVGVSAYRIDLGIVHPDDPNRYLAGVECDGPMYRSATFAVERDKIRQAVLEGLGWQLLRLWSLDWWTNPEKAIDELNSALKALLEEERAIDHESNSLRATT